MPKVTDTKNATDCLWKAYQFTDELAAFMEWIEDMRSKALRHINTDSGTYLLHGLMHSAIKIAIPLLSCKLRFRRSN